jgi:3-oxoacyl-[acyl-carrier-protein] synthase-1
MSEPRPDAFVAASGMVAALGADVATNCAAARAGLVRAGAIDHYAARSDVEGEIELVIGHQAGFLTRGFEGEMRLVRLVQGALSDLLVQSSGRIDWTGGARFYVAVPDVHRPWSGLELIGDEAARQTRAEALAQRQHHDAADNAASNSAAARRIVAKGAASANWPGGDVTPAFISVSGHAAALQAVAAAMRDLASGVTHTAVVLAVDSWLDEATLEWLDATGRLKRDGMPVGLQPGEAGVAIALTSSRPRGQAPAVRGAVSEAHETRTLLSGATTVGEALAQVVAQATASSPTKTAWIVSDQNGEVYRATDWGYAVVRLRAQFEQFADPVVWYPAASFGDVGAASALAGMCVAERAWLRGYAPAPTALIVAASDGPLRAAVALSAE